MASLPFPVVVVDGLLRRLEPGFQRLVFVDGEPEVAGHDLQLFVGGDEFRIEIDRLHQNRHGFGKFPVLVQGRRAFKDGLARAGRRLRGMGDAPQREKAEDPCNAQEMAFHVPASMEMNVDSAPSEWRGGVPAQREGDPPNAYFASNENQRPRTL